MDFKQKLLSVTLSIGLITGSTFASLAHTQQLEVHHINVGQGESIYKEFPDGIDALIGERYIPIYYKLEDPEFRESIRVEFLKLVNDYRQSNGKKKLEEKENLNNLADDWSVYKTKWGFNEDTDPNGKRSNDLYPQYGGSSSEINFSTVAYSSMISLNLHTSQALANEIFDQVKKDAVYNSTMLNDEFNGVGFGCYPCQIDGSLIVVYNTIEFSVK